MKNPNSQLNYFVFQTQHWVTTTKHSFECTKMLKQISLYSFFINIKHKHCVINKSLFVQSGDLLKIVNKCASL